VCPCLEPTNRSVSWTLLLWAYTGFSTWLTNSGYLPERVWCGQRTSCLLEIIRTIEFCTCMPYANNVWSGRAMQHRVTVVKLSVDHWTGDRHCSVLRNMATDVTQRPDVVVTCRLLLHVCWLPNLERCSLGDSWQWHSHGRLCSRNLPSNNNMASISCGFIDRQTDRQLRSSKCWTAPTQSSVRIRIIMCYL